jgi:triacylglycerol lipase
MTSPVVVILHGLARSHRSMARLRRFLESEGYRTWCATYPSREMEIKALAAQTAARIRAEAPADQYFAVTHSLGGILVRHMRDALPWSRVVMLAPPNQGSRIARAFGSHPLFRWFYGPAGQDVSAPETWPAPPEPFAVIAGTRDLSIANPTSWVTKSAALFPPGSPSDGTIAVEEARHPSMAAYAELDASHTLIMNDPRAHALTLAFLRNGTFPTSGSAR